jgi:carbonic anhydrase/acetyltransferase-like protein (isoleucine patch superfamily)
VIFENKFPFISLKCEIDHSVIFQGSVYVKDEVKISGYCKFKAINHRIVLESFVIINENSSFETIESEVRIGKNTIIGRNCIITASIGENCIIEDGVRISQQIGDNCWIKSGEIVDEPLTSYKMLEKQNLSTIDDNILETARS